MRQRKTNSKRETSQIRWIKWITQIEIRNAPDRPEHGAPAQQIEGDVGHGVWYERRILRYIEFRFHHRAYYPWIGDIEAESNNAREVEKGGDEMAPTMTEALFLIENSAWITVSASGPGNTRSHRLNQLLSKRGSPSTWLSHSRKKPAVYQ